MVGVDCAICKQHVIIYDITFFQYQSYADSMEYSAGICDECLPKDRVKLLDCRPWKPEPFVPKTIDELFASPEPGSQFRFTKRKKTVPWLKHTFWWVIHNCVSHPLIGVLPFKPLFDFHDWTSYKMHDKSVV